MEKLSLESLILTGFLGLLSLTIVWVGKKLEQLTESVVDLNLRFAVFIEQHKSLEESHGDLKEQVEDHDERIRLVESKH